MYFVGQSTTARRFIVTLTCIAQNNQHMNASLSVREPGAARCSRRRNGSLLGYSNNCQTVVESRIVDRWNRCMLDCRIVPFAPLLQTVKPCVVLVSYPDLFTCLRKHNRIMYNALGVAFSLCSNAYVNGSDTRLASCNVFDIYTLEVLGTGKINKSFIRQT